jgi:hypothetical protein
MSILRLWGFFSKTNLKTILFRLTKYAVLCNLPKKDYRRKVGGKNLLIAKVDFFSFFVQNTKISVF